MAERVLSPGDWDGYDASSHFDEFLTPDREARPGCDEVRRRIDELGPELLERQQAGEAAIRSMGITFTLYTDDSSIDRAWPMDVVPRIITASEWSRVSAGLIQRLQALNLFIDDLYHDQRAVKAGVFPGELLDDSVNYRKECRGVDVAGGVWAHICGSDLVRDADGEFYVLEDNLRVPSGVSYMLENRQVSKRVFADLFADLDILPVDGYTDDLGHLLRSLTPRPGEEPVVVVLTPGIFNSAYYEHVLLATRTGAHLVEGSDLVVSDDVVYMRTVSGLIRVDVIYRRVDDVFLDPLVFREDSVLGAPGLMGAWAAGNVAIANAPGAGVADDKVVYSYVPDLIRYYLDEEPLIRNVPTWRCGDVSERAYVLEHLDELVSKPANESGGKGVTIGPRASAAELDELRRMIEADPRNWIAQPVLDLSTAPTLCDGRLAPRHLDLRPFVLSGATPSVTVGGLTRVALEEGSLIVNSSQGGGSKDTWIIDERTP
ncbi:MAG: circularly permuted type 2 ATP-grasp protein [Acidimicrobiales bacterium]